MTNTIIILLTCYRDAAFLTDLIFRGELMFSVSLFMVFYLGVFEWMSDVDSLNIWISYWIRCSRRRNWDTDSRLDLTFLDRPGSGTSDCRAFYNSLIKYLLLTVVTDELTIHLMVSSNRHTWTDAEPAEASNVCNDASFLSDLFGVSAVSWK